MVDVTLSQSCMLETILRLPVGRGKGPWFSRHAVIITYNTIFVYAIYGVTGAVCMYVAWE